LPEPEAVFQVNASELPAKFPKLASRRSEVQLTQAGDRDGIEHSAGDIGS